METQKFKIALKRLYKSMSKKSRVLPHEKRNKILELISKYPDTLKVKGTRIIISREFYLKMIKELKLDDGSGNLDNDWYIFFRKLQKYNLIHASSSYFPKKLAFISMNPNPAYLYKSNLSVMDEYAVAKSSLYCDFEILSLEQKIQDAFIDLRLYQPLALQVKEFKELDISNVIFVSDTRALVYIELNGVFTNIDISPYQLISIEGKKLIDILQQCKEIGISKPFANLPISIIDKHRESFYSNNISTREIHYATSIKHLTSSTPLQVLIKTDRKILSSLTISELKAMPNITIPVHLLEVEKKRIAIAQTRAIEYIDPEEKIDTDLEALFSLSEFDELEELLKIKQLSKFVRKIPSIKRELQKYIDAKDSQTHGILICEYIIYLLNRIDGKNKIRITTFKDYLHNLQKHLFNKVEDLSIVEAHEIDEIILNMSINYKDRTIRKTRGLIKSFFNFHNKEHKFINVKLASYPKSLVLDKELDVILEQVEAKAIFSADRVGNRVRYKVLRDKAIILFARYTGMRKNELRGRYLKDVWINGTTLCVDVNSIGMKKLDMQLKTKTAKRRICVEIKKQEHLEIIKEYMFARESLNNKNKYLFLDVSRHYDIPSKPVREETLDDFNSIIQDVTKRYTSFHSLRHSFATYEFKKILESGNNDPHQLIDLSVKMGHESPETTLRVYVHRSVLEMGGAL